MNYKVGQVVRIKENPSMRDWTGAMMHLKGQKRKVLYVSSNKVAVNDRMDGTGYNWWIYNVDLDPSFRDYKFAVRHGVTYRVCADCGVDLIGDGPFNDFNTEGHPICSTCKENYVDCHYCGTMHPVRQMTSVINSDEPEPQLACRECIRTSFFKCNHCGELHHRRYRWYSGNGTHICNTCSQHYTRCENCGILVVRGNEHTVRNRDYCSVCFERVPSPVIHEFNYKPKAKFYKTRRISDAMPNGFYGVELEVDRGTSRNRTAEAIKEIGGAPVYIKRDGSLENGFEIVTHPATMEYHMTKMPWKEMCDKAMENEFKSHDCSTCGLHIHASRTLFGDDRREQELTIAKVMLLFDKFWDEYIVPFSRRDIHRLERWASKPNASIKCSDSDEEVYDKVQNASDKGRYQAINLTNRATVEFRIFKGTLKTETILASLQWVELMIQFARERKLSDMWSVTWEEIFGDVRYNELRNYLQNKSLIGVYK